MTFAESLHTVLIKKYATFSGRAARSEYWWFTLASVGTSVILGVLGMIMGAVEVFDTIDSIISIAILVPSVAVACRRLHDTDRSGWWQVLPAAPVLVAAFTFGSGTDGLGWAAVVVAGICLLIVIVWLATQGTPGPNRFGDDPLNPDTDAEIFA